MDILEPKLKAMAELNLKDDKELFEMLNKYRRILGWTWKRFLLVGIAELINKNDDNPDVIVKIADYLSDRR